MSGNDIAWLVALGAPVLCLDTCAVLDLMRDPTRDNVRSHERAAALDLLVAAEGGSKLVALLADQVVLELGEHMQNVEDEAREAIVKLKAQLGRIDAVAAIYGSVGTADLRHLDDHVMRARKIVDRWTKAVVVANQRADVPNKALIRLNSARTPARKGKDSMKDCVVIETYLDTVRSLRGASHTHPIVFASSNTKDYVGEIGSALKPDLAAEFASLQMDYAPNWAAAKYQLGFR
ncbi:MAG: DUF4935 domain-containing protein [Rhodospirillaceae bacterium]|nr:DUF4935 domain-containing protein [Rhodospirillaceae bacterium]